MEFRILGPLEVLSDGQAVDLGGAKQRALLAVLLLDANQVVSMDRLIDALWEDDPPETATKALQVYVSEAAQADRQRAVADAGRPAICCASRGTSSIWSAFASCRRAADRRRRSLSGEARRSPTSPTAVSPRPRSRVWRISASPASRSGSSSDLHARRHAELTAELEALVAEHPLRERLRGAADARALPLRSAGGGLEAYQAARRALVDELGIEPGRELRELHQAILNQDPALDLPPEARQSREPEPPSAPPDAAGASVEPVARRCARPSRRLRRRSRSSSVSGRSSSTPRRCGASPAARSARSRPRSSVTAARSRRSRATRSRPSSGCRSCTRMTRCAACAPPSRSRDAPRRPLPSSCESERPARLEFADRGQHRRGRHRRRRGSAAACDRRAADRRRRASPRQQSPARSSSTRPRVGSCATRSSSEPASDAWRLVSTDRRRPAPRRRLVSPMVGRERERRRLHDAFDQAVGDRSCQLFTVLGPAGVGKSRLVQEFLGDLAGRRASRVGAASPTARASRSGRCWRRSRRRSGSRTRTRPRRAARSWPAPWRRAGRRTRSPSASRR